MERDHRSRVPANVMWALARNPGLTPVLLAKYPPHREYWNYLEELIGFLKTAGCNGIQEKVLDVGANNLFKFESTISEFEMAKRLSLKGKKVTLLPDDFLPGKSPDLLVEDPERECYVEVTRFSDDDTMYIVSEEVTRLLDESCRPFRIDVTLSRELSTPVTGYRDRKARETQVRAIMHTLEKALAYDLPRLPTGIVIDGVKFEISESPNGTGFVGAVHSGVVTIPLNEYSDRIRYIVANSQFGKAVKRLSWRGNHLQKPYIIAIDCQRPLIHEESFTEALFGSRHHYSQVPPNIPTPPEIEIAAKSGWRSFLKDVHLIPGGKTVFTSQGIFLTDPICKNVSGVAFLRRWKDTFQFLPNPFASDEINDPGLVSFLSRGKGNGT